MNDRDRMRKREKRTKGKKLTEKKKKWNDVCLIGEQKEKIFFLIRN
jgi:hypothetical protein